MVFLSEHDLRRALSRNESVVQDEAPWQCRMMGHRWPKALRGDYWERIGRPTYWSVRSYCTREGCPYMREADLAGVNPRIHIPWSEPRAMLQSERDAEREHSLSRMRVFESGFPTQVGTSAFATARKPLPPWPDSANPYT